MDSGKSVTRLAEVSGGGGGYLQDAIDEGADCLVTGEAAHHIALLARQEGVGLVVAGHWGTEQGIADVPGGPAAGGLPPAGSTPCGGRYRPLYLFERLMPACGPEGVKLCLWMPPRWRWSPTN